jgi:hypothetical protein
MGRAARPLATWQGIDEKDNRWESQSDKVVNG